ncbi:MAG: ammonia-forming cytochrome c nitrite reductase subunit c552 [Thermoguttaceae bacterium]
MRYPARVTLVGVLMIVGLASWLGLDTSRRNCRSQAEAVEPAAGKSPGKTTPLPPLKVDRSAPLLLEEPTDRKSPARMPAPVAENHACLVCHANYEAEPLALRHAQANVACVDCHGQSLSHRNDENNVTPPDKMYPADRIDAACQQCHRTHAAMARDVIARWLKRCPSKKDPSQIVCTDCHGEHRLQRRTVSWDRNSGKLIRPSAEPPKAAGDPPRPAGPGRP